MLRELGGNYFEREGLCFLLVPKIEDRACWMHIYFQNRYRGSCETRIVVQPLKPVLFSKRVAMPGIDIDIACPGGAFGLCRFVWPIPKENQGMSLKFDVAADTTYPKGRGKLVRFREGLNVGAPVSNIRSAAVTGGLLLVGVIHVSKAASVTFQLPQNVIDYVPNNTGVGRQILFEPDFNTGGFPVLPASKA